MRIIINASSMEPYYEQIIRQIREEIIVGNLKENDALPSVRTLANELKISVLTVKKAYDTLEAEGLIKTIHGKGSYIACVNPNASVERIKCEMEDLLAKVLSKASSIKMSKEELKALFEIYMEEY